MTARTCWGVTWLGSELSCCVLRDDRVYKSGELPWYHPAPHLVSQRQWRHTVTPPRSCAGGVTAVAACLHGFAAPTLPHMCPQPPATRCGGIVRRHKAFLLAVTHPAARSPVADTGSATHTPPTGGAVGCGWGVGVVVFRTRSPPFLASTSVQKSRRSAPDGERLEQRVGQLYY